MNPLIYTTKSGSFHDCEDCLYRKTDRTFFQSADEHEGIEYLYAVFAC